MKAYIFPGQGAQYPGMGQDFYTASSANATLFETANEHLGFNIADIMFFGTEADLRQTNVTQPAIFLHSVVAAKHLGSGFEPAMVAGHSLGEFSALVAIGALSFEAGLRLVSIRANAMQLACEAIPGTMAAILGLSDAVVMEVCEELTNNGQLVVAANFNCPGQLVISGTNTGVAAAIEILKQKGARNAVLLPVGGAFHSPLMEPARQALATAIEETVFNKPICPIYQNVVAQAVTDPSVIKANLIAQLTGPVKWTQTMEAIIAAGATNFIECGPGKVLQGLVKKINRQIPCASVNID